jgi:hypothetical protein
MYTVRLTRLIVACLAVLAALTASAQASQMPAPQTQPGDLLDPRTYAPASEIFLALHATGTQNYVCQPNGAWVFSDPVAALYDPAKGEKPVGRHYLNFATGRPVWQHKDGSTVEAARKATMSGGAGNIASLVLQAVVTTAGSDGDRLFRTTWVQRLNSVGGVAPDGSCAPGTTVAVPYSTDYVFWTSSEASEDQSDG